MPKFDRFGIDRIKYDTATEKWMREHWGVETTVVRCRDCGLCYKPELGHKCKMERTRKHEQENR